ncbi:VapE domain-containing protein [Bradyrhizobium genosp. P]|uniref:VapE domain-containing protein n=1 Tax=Bradyrhizobium genosp. P TaxID=83641 RepID=UPI003CF2F3FC
MPNVPALTTSQTPGPIVPQELPDEFRDFAGKGKDAMPANSMHSSLVALKKLGLDCSYNVFRNEYLIGGASFGEGTELSDNAELALRHIIADNFGFEPSPVVMHDAVRRACTMRSFHPVRDYLNSLPPWDGIERASRLLPDYFMTADTAFTRGVSRILVMASVRRIFKPGTKFDYLSVLHSKEGLNKSSAISALYGETFYTDQSTILLNARDTEEALRGHWAQEIAELDGLGKADWGRLKAQLSRTNDRNRRVFERNPTSAPRSCVQWATTNDHTYLRALSGMNRRFFSLDVLKMIDVAKIVADRDDIWSEAVEMEASGESIMLPQALWADAAVERQKRTAHDPWEDVLTDVSERGVEAARAAIKRGDVVPYEIIGDEERVASSFLLDTLCIQEKDRQPQHASRAALVMRLFQWEGPTSVRIGGRNVKGYTRPMAWV